MANSAFTGAYNSFSGVDIKAVAGSEVLAELQAVSYSISREKAPIYTMGSADPRSFSRGKRGIAGTLVFIMFDRHALLRCFSSTWGAKTGSSFLSDIDDLRPEYAKQGSAMTTQAANDLITGSNSQRFAATNGRPTAANVQLQESLLSDGVSSDQEPTSPWYADQILPFDITLAAANEYGALAVMRIYGVEILNEGMGVSIDDIQTSQQMTYVARLIVGWRSLGQDTRMNPNGIVNQKSVNSVGTVSGNANL